MAAYFHIPSASEFTSFWLVAWAFDVLSWNGVTSRQMTPLLFPLLIWWNYNISSLYFFCFHCYITILSSELKCEVLLFPDIASFDTPYIYIILIADRTQTTKNVWLNHLSFSWSCNGLLDEIRYAHILFINKYKEAFNSDKLSCRYCPVLCIPNNKTLSLAYIFCLLPLARLLFLFLFFFLLSAHD